MLAIIIDIYELLKGFIKHLMQYYIDNLAKLKLYHNEYWSNRFYVLLPNSLCILRQINQCHWQTHIQIPFAALISNGWLKNVVIANGIIFLFFFLHGSCCHYIIDLQKSWYSPMTFISGSLLIFYLIRFRYLWNFLSITFEFDIL